MTLRDVMSTRVYKVGPDQGLRVVRNLFERHRFHHLVVVQRGQAIGVVSDRDLLRHISPFVGRAMMERPQDRQTLNLRVHQIMTRRLVTGGPDDDIQVAADRMIAAGVSCLPVLDQGGKVLGIVSWRDLLAAYQALAPLPAGS